MDILKNKKVIDLVKGSVPIEETLEEKRDGIHRGEMSRRQDAMNKIDAHNMDMIRVDRQDKDAVNFDSYTPLEMELHPGVSTGGVLNRKLNYDDIPFDEVSESKYAKLRGSSEDDYVSDAMTRLYEYKKRAQTDENYPTNNRPIIFGEEESVSADNLETLTNMDLDRLRKIYKGN